MKNFFTILCIFLCSNVYCQMSLLKDINPGSESSNPRHFTNVNGTLFFTAYEPSTGYELYKSNNTSAGTKLLLDIGAADESTYPKNLVVLGSKLIFTRTNEAGGMQVWVSDGTVMGTELLRTIFPDDDFWLASELIVVGKAVFFITESQGERFTLYKTDGTREGTVQVSELPIHVLTGITQLDGYLYFSDYSNIYKSDGTCSGTSIVDNGLNGFFRVITSFKGKIYFHLFGFINEEDEVFTDYLFTTDGTPGSEKLVKEIAVSSELVQMGGYLYFVGVDHQKGKELWRTNGTTSGTTMVKEINTKGDSFEDDHPNTLFASGNTLYFVATDNSGERTLYKTNGTSSGTVKIVNAPTFAPKEYIKVESTSTMAYFTQGNSLWKTDGSEAGTKIIKTFTAPVAALGRVYSALYVAGTTAATGNEIWKYLPTSTAAASMDSTSLSNITVSPNTFETTTRVSLPGLALDQPLTVNVLNLSGKLISSFKVKNVESFEVGRTLPSGMFVLQVVSGKEAYSKIIIKE